MKRFSDQQKMALGRAGFLCLDCQLDTDKAEQYYMINNGLWCSINHKVIGMLCLLCAERRLGRNLVRTDFTQAPVNRNQARKCSELALRLEREKPPLPKQLNRLKRRSRSRRR